jgi:hypothetical protein
MVKWFFCHVNNISAILWSDYPEREREREREGVI